MTRCACNIESLDVYFFFSETFIFSRDTSLTFSDVNEAEKSRKTYDSAKRLNFEVTFSLMSLS